jgi:DNA topoisomerase I
MPRAKAKVIPFPTDPTKSAAIAGLRYVKAEGPGIRRIRHGKSFRYVLPDGKPLTDRAELARIHSLVIPPAWEDVWICPAPHGHIQAVGWDARGRKQYRYHPSYRQVRDQTKFGRMLAFGAALPKIRERVEADLSRPGLPKEKVLAAIIRLLDSTGMRIGNDEYKKQNDSYGLTTLQDKHVQVAGAYIRFKFRGKSGQMQDIQLNDARLARIVKRCRDLPGYELFQYVDADGKVCDITSSDVNDYIRDITGQDFSAKDFRTWGGTGFAALVLEEMGAAESKTAAKKNIVTAVKSVAEKLGNRPATCKKYYVHPAVLDAYEDGTLFGILSTCACATPGNLARQEECVMKLVAKYIEKLAPPKKPGEDYVTELKASLRRKRA